MKSGTLLQSTPGHGHESRREYDDNDGPSRKDAEGSFGEQSQPQAEAKQQRNPGPLEALRRQKKIDGEGDHGGQREFEVEVAGHGIEHGKAGQQEGAHQSLPPAAPSLPQAVGRRQHDGQIDDIDHGGDVGRPAEQCVRDNR